MIAHRAEDPAYEQTLERFLEEQASFGKSEQLECRPPHLHERTEWPLPSRGWRPAAPFFRREIELRYRVRERLDSHVTEARITARAREAVDQDVLLENAEVADGGQRYRRLRVSVSGFRKKDDAIGTEDTEDFAHGVRNIRHVVDGVET